MNGKTFRIALEGNPNTLDPTQAASVRTDRVAWLIYDTLLKMKQDGTGAGPGLALAVPALVPHGGKWKVTVDLGSLKFSNGNPLIADHVCDSIDRRHKVSDAKKTTRRKIGECVSRAKKIDGNTVELTLDHPALHYLCDLEIFDGNAGTGPFMYDASQATSSAIVLTRNTHHLPPPKIDQVQFLLKGDEAQCVAALQNGEVDFVPAITDPHLIAELKTNPAEFETVQYGGLSIFYVGFITGRSPFGNVGIRQALVKAIDPASALGGFNSHSPNGPVAPGAGPIPPQMQDYYDPNQHQSIQDVNAARAQLQQLPEGRDLLSGARSVILAFNTRKNLDRQVATNIATQLGLPPAGLGIQIIPVPAYSYGELVDKVRSPHHNVDLFIYSWHVRGPYPERILVPLFHSDWKASNLTGYNGADRHLEDVLKNSPNNSQVGTAVQKIIQDAPMIFLGHVTRTAAWRKPRVILGSFTPTTWLNKWDGMPCDKLASVGVV